jgi:2-(1,2-epoxy-1,2-dihydrophenyl)acetyl-CoA isomerase
MEYACIEVTNESGVQTIQLNRPEVLNSFNQIMGKELQQVLKESACNANIRCIVLTGAGRAFSAGQDLAEAIAPNGPEIADIVREIYNPIIQAIRTIDKPIIAMVNGVAAGAGANIALACDLIMASKEASFIQSFSKIGLIPDSGGTFFLPRLLGLHRANALTMLAEKISAEQAMQWGLVYGVYPQEQLQKETMILASRIAAMPTYGIALTKQAFNSAWDNSLTQQLETEAKFQSLAAASEDHREGVNAFLEKRSPKFKGK